MAKTANVIVVVVLALLSLQMMTTTTAAPSRPHIVVIWADDLGWSDVSFRDPEVHTPHLDKMAAEGVQLDYSYTNPACTPSRAAFLTGVYPFRMGLQNSVLTALENASLPLEYPLLSEHLQGLGYSTHLVGKWHLGFCKHDMTPTRRGFDTFYGMYNGQAGYFSHVSKWDGYDLQDNVGPDPANWRADTEGNGTYSTTLFTDRAVQVVQSHDASAGPLFLYLSYQAVHGPLEVPDEYLTHCQGIADELRRKHCAMTVAMDEGVGRVRQALEDSGMGDNLITLFMSDNGGAVKQGSSNAPLKGAKVTLWEGGTRVVTLLHSKTLLPQAPYTFNGLMHAVDWYPTLVHAAGDKNEVTGIDGLENWRKIVKNSTNSRRSSFVYNIDDVKNKAALRYKKFKLMETPAADGADGFQYQLFNVVTDPGEQSDLSNKASKQALMAEMKTMLNSFKQDLKPTEDSQKVEAGKPIFHDGLWVSGWC